MINPNFFLTVLPKSNVKYQCQKVAHGHNISVVLSHNVTIRSASRKLGLRKPIKTVLRQNWHKD
jgi:hypothetical protein